MLLYILKKHAVRNEPDLCDENHVLAAEFLLQLTHEPHLDLLEGLQLGHRHKDDDGFSVANNIDFLREENQ